MTDYDTMLQEVEHPWCWACGAGATDKPEGWDGPWLIERAHIVDGAAVRRRAYVVLLCSGCHKAADHGLRIFTQEHKPRLTVANLLWLKSRFDPKFYARELLQQVAVGNLPRASKPDRWYMNQYLAKRGFVR